MSEIKQVERVIRILQRLALYREITVRQLYDYFEQQVPQRTLQRDLQELSCANIPLYTKPGRGRELVWCLDEEFVKFIPMTLSSRELMVSYFLERLAAVTRGTRLESDIQSLLAKAKQLVSPDVFRTSDQLENAQAMFGATFVGHIDYGPHSETIDTLVQAISQCRRCRFIYKSNWKSEPSDFEADPYLLLYHKGALYAVVYTPAHDNYIFLPIQRIRSVSLASNTFTRDPSFSLEHLREGRFGIFGGENLTPRRVVLRFTPDIADVVAERIWHQSQVLTREDSGHLVMELETVVSDELRSWVGGWLHYVSVIEPEDLLSHHDHEPTG
ncbi:MAG: WYL domain-containing transcriptional regulator [candidate division Zixibacteria bacterium]|jgi:predicted DNA-binding transcriptional regulator YafY|nr:WYL domain-containing transcriptional regulator [candidate division Zixibacteria bacterium]